MDRSDEIAADGIMIIRALVDHWGQAPATTHNPKRWADAAAIRSTTRLTVYAWSDAVARLREQGAVVVDGRWVRLSDGAQRELSDAAPDADAS